MSNGTSFTTLAAAGGKAMEAAIAASEGVDLVEMMACPGGCQGGGGVARSCKMDMIEKSMEAEDEKRTQKCAGENPVCTELEDMEKFITSF